MFAPSGVEGAHLRRGGWEEDPSVGQELAFRPRIITVVEFGESQMPQVKQESTAQDPALREIVRRLVAAYRPERVYLFGSRARAEADRDSDYDLMVIVPDDAPPQRRRSRIAYEALRGTGTAADVLVWTREAFDRRLHLRASLPSTIVAEGKLLYTA